MNQLPHYVELRQSRHGHLRAFLVGTRVRVQDIYVMSEMQGYTPDEIVDALPHLTLAQVHAALTYYFEHPQDIKEEMRIEDEIVRRFQAERGPSPLEKKLAERNAISP